VTDAARPVVSDGARASHNGVTGKARDPSKRQRKRSRRALLSVGAAESAPRAFLERAVRSDDL
jgi:hypothetical protein